jgi:hypothetical protein
MARALTVVVRADSLLHAQTLANPISRQADLFLSVACSWR